MRRLLRTLLLPAVAAVLLAAPALVIAGDRVPDGSLYVQGAEGGSLTKGREGAWRLTLSEPAVRTTFFSDRPLRRGGSLPLSRFVADWKRTFGGDAPNAALAIDGAPAGRDVALLELSRPTWNRSRDELSFRARTLPSSGSGAALSALADRADSGVHGSFGRASLFIDDGGEANLLTLTFSSVAPQSGIELGLPNAKFAYTPAATLNAETAGIDFGSGVSILQVGCGGVGGACSGSVSISVASSAAKPLEGVIVMPSAGTVSASWAGGPTTTFPAAGGPFTLQPAG